MKSTSPASRVLRAQLAEHFELFLTTAGVLLAIMVAVSELSRGEQGMTLTFLIWLQGFILWAVHRHCWFRRRALVYNMRAMLQDRVNNQLTVMLAMAGSRGKDLTETEREDLAVAISAARTVSRELEGLSFESLRAWERRYGRFLNPPLR